MKKIIFNHSQKNLSIIIDGLMIAIGIIGIVGGLTSSLYFPTNCLWTIGIFVIYGWFLYYWQSCGKSIIKVTVSSFIFICIGCLSFTSQFQNVLGQLKNVIQYDYFLRFDVIFKNAHVLDGLLPILFISLLGVPLVYIIISFVTINKRRLLKLFFFIILFLFPIFIKHEINQFTGYCFIAFLIYEFVMTYSLSHIKRSLPLQSLLLVSLSIFLVFSFVFLEPNPIFKKKTSTVLSNITNWIDSGAFDRLFENSQITGATSSISGGLPSGNITLNDNVAVEVETAYPFTSYLRGYSLAHYDNNRWNPVYENFENSHSVSLYSDFIKKYHSSTALQSVHITTKKSLSYKLVPYFPIIDQELIADSYYNGNKDEVSILRYGNQIDNYYYAGINDKSSQDYQAYVESEYLEVPTELKQKLLDFLELKGIYPYYDKVDIDDSLSLAQEIRTVLSSETKYDLKAGMLPDNKDFVEYFLFENRKGSCTHYATTGALMLRSLGVPTRYVSGFIMKASDFKDGKAQIRNNRSHAWIEIYLENQGWVPIEMTPSTGGQNTDGIGSMLDELLTDPNQNTNTTQPDNAPDTTNDQTNTIQDTTQKVEDTQEHWYDDILAYSQYIAYILGAFLMIVIYRIISLKWFFAKLHRQSSNQKVILYYQRMMRISYSDRMIQKDILDIAYKAKFSQHHISDEEVKRVEDYYVIFVKEVYQSLPIYRKIIFKYIYGYI